MAKSVPQAPRRPYSSPAREAQAQATKRAILDAARLAFADRGYGGSTIEAVAAAARVSVPTVYAVFGSKARLLSAAVADAGSAPAIRKLAETALSETRAERRIAAAAKVVRSIMEHEQALLHVLREAGTATPELDAARRQVHRQQRDALGRALRPLDESGSLRAGLGFEEAVATFAALASPESYWLLVDEFGWSAARWERWLAQSAIRLLLQPDPGSAKRP